MLNVHNTLTKEQLREHSKEQLIELIESYQKFVKTSNHKKRTITEVEDTLTFLSPKVHELKKTFSYDVDSPLGKSEQKTFFSQRTIGDQYKVPCESDLEIIKYKKIVSVLLDAAAQEQRTDLISDVQCILSNSKTNIL